MKVETIRSGLTLRGLLEGTDRFDNEELVILLHGFKADLGYEEGELLYDLSKYLNQAGFATLRFDFAGCGNSDGKFEKMTVISELLDAIQIFDFARKNLDAKTIHLIGHSQGGVVASFLASYYSDLITDLVLLSPAASLKDDALRGDCQGVKYDPHHIPDSIMVKGYKVGGAYFRIAQQLPIYETAEDFKKSVLLIHGNNDTIVPTLASERYHAIYHNSNLKLIDGANHHLSGKMNQRQEVMETVVHFLTKSK